MKSNLVNAGGSGWKRSFALALAALAMVAVLVVGGGLATPRSAEAQTTGMVTWVPPSLGAERPGAKIWIEATFTAGLSTASGGYAQFTIENTAARATFDVTGTTSLLCRDKAPASGNTPARTSTCDAEPTPTANKIRFWITIDENSGTGPIVIRAAEFGKAPATQVLVLNVNTESLRGPISITPAATSIASSGASTTFIVRLLNTAGRPSPQSAGIEVTTTLGLLTCFASGGSTTKSQRCAGSENNIPNRGGGTGPGTGGTGVNSGGMRTFTLESAGTPGIATVTATVFGTTNTTSVKIVFYGSPSRVTLAPEQGAIAIGGKTFVVATVTDSAGNPISSRQLTGTTKGPATDSVKVIAANNVDKIVVPDSGSLPACGNATTGANAAKFPAGTNAKGQCVIEVTAPAKGATVPASASRGAHTVTVTLTATVKATATIMVGGPPKTINTDAPARVAPLSATTVNITVLDDMGVRVGGVPLSIDKIEGSGAVRTPTPTTTTDGRAAFTYVASSGGSAVFLIRAGTGAARINKTIEVAIGDPAPAKTWSGSIVVGWNNLNWQGAEGASIADAIGAGVTAVYRWNQAAQRWDAYFPSAVGVPGANDFTTLSQGASYWVFSR